MTEARLREIIFQVGHFPTRGELLERDSRGLINAITKFGGMNAWRKRFGHTTGRKDDGYWRKPESVERELEEDIKARGHFPTKDDLIRDNKSSFAKAIEDTGGYRFWRNKFGFNIRKPRGYWDNLDNIQYEIEDYILKYGHFPKQKQLKKIGQGSLANAIIATGGFQAWVERIGLIKKDFARQETSIADFLEVEDE